MGIQELLKSKRESILGLATRHGAKNVRIFGSAARGDARPDSDIDFLIDMQPERSLFDHISLMQDLEQLLGRKIDLVTARSLHWYIRDRVLSEAIPL